MVSTPLIHDITSHTTYHVHVVNLYRYPSPIHRSTHRLIPIPDQLHHAKKETAYQSTHYPPSPPSQQISSNTFTVPQWQALICVDDPDATGCVDWNETIHWGDIEGECGV